MNRIAPARDLRPSGPPRSLGDTNLRTGADMKRAPAKNHAVARAHATTGRTVRPQIQHQFCLHSALAQVMWLQPWFFSVGAWARAISPFRGHRSQKNSLVITSDNLAVIAPLNFYITEGSKLRCSYRGVPLGRLIENPKLIGKRCQTSVFNDPF